MPTSTFNEPGPIALPLDSDEAPQVATDGGGLRKFRRRVFSVFTVCCIITLVGFWERTPKVGRGVDDLGHTVGVAYDPRLESYQNPADAKKCAEWPFDDTDLVSGTEPERHLSSMSFELPAEADLLFFLSRGPVFGHVDIIKTSEYSTGPIEVNVTAQYHDLADLKRTTVCRMGQDASNEHGLLVWAEPRHPHGDPQRDVRFNITIALPSGLRRYRDLTTDLPMFSHIASFFDFWSPTEFGVIRLKSSLATINHGSLMGESAFIQTSNAKVEGFFAGTQKLSVQTSNSPINSVALMIGESRGSEVDVELRTSNGDIESNLGIMTDFPDTVLRATLQTSVGSLKIGTPTRMGATNSSFFLDASTSVSPATLYLHPEYEGTYDLGTSLSTARVEVDKDISDPIGKGRQRMVRKTTTGSHAEGYIYWSDDGEPTEGVQQGAVKIKTSTSPITVYC
ncbi:hypothetical protein B0H10DRAFT_1937835 [Mycena sp. CBHHK59/15]|nr:hypothetical protein B0H10DRAFT_1937835 [Mycena sp. CBHHK59/15]